MIIHRLSNDYPCFIHFLSRLSMEYPWTIHQILPQQAKLYFAWGCRLFATGADVAALTRELRGVLVVQAPVLKGERNNLRQLCIEMSVASQAHFFVVFGDGVVQGHASMPGLLVMQISYLMYT